DPRHLAAGRPHRARHAAAQTRDCDPGCRRVACERRYSLEPCRWPWQTDFISTIGFLEEKIMRTPGLRILACGAFIAVTAYGGAAQRASAPRDLKALARQALSKIDGDLSVPGLRDSVEVIRDTWGVPHIYAKNVDDLFFAQGYVMGQDRMWQLEMW